MFKAQKMNPVVKQRWVDGLLSGTYIQGQSCLRTSDDKFCCLGVLTDIYSKESGIEWSKNVRANSLLVVHSFQGEPTLLPAVVQEWAELRSENPDTDIEKLSALSPDVYLHKTLAELNDEGKSFKEIAEIIERCL